MHGTIVNHDAPVKLGGDPFMSPIAYGAGVGDRGDWSNSNGTIDPRSTPVPTSPQLVAGHAAGTFAEDDDYFLFVHGWNMATADRVSMGNTAHKRLYWQGFRGTFGIFTWPTQISAGLSDAGNFNRSEEVAWNSAAGLLNFLNSKQTLRQAGGKLTVMAHSMGGIVTSEALRLAGANNVVDTTILTQAAVTTEFYGTTAPATPYYSAFGGEVGGANPRFSSIGQAPTTLLNFNNEGDYALAAWFENNQAKPGGPHHFPPPNPLAQIGFLGAHYEVTQGPPATVWRIINQAPASLTMPTDRYEMFAHGLYTESRAIGSVNPTLFPPFTAHLDLRTYGFGFSRIDHSGQFNHSLIEMSLYWSRVKIEAGF